MLALMKIATTRCIAAFASTLWLACGTEPTSEPVVPSEINPEVPTEIDAEVPRSASGSRLKARVLRLPGAPDVLIDFYDEKLEATCTFALADDGELRCMPASNEGRWPSSGEDGVSFLDAACEKDRPAVFEKELLRADTGEDKRLYVRTGGAPGTECDGYGVMEVTKLGPDTPLYRKSDEGCVLRTPRAPLLRELRKLDASEMVLGEQYNVIQPGERFGVRTVRGEDGSLAVLAAYDSMTDGTCRVSEGPDTTSACVPGEAWITDAYSTKGCRGESVQLAKLARSCRSAPPAFVFDDYASMCFRVLDPHAGRVYKRGGEEDVCSVSTEPLFEIEPAPACPGTLDVFELGTGALRPYYVGHSGQPWVGALTMGGRTLWDGGSYCKLRAWSADNLVCPPQTLRMLWPRYADADCKSLLGSAPPISEFGDDELVYVGESLLLGVFSVGDRYDGPAYTLEGNQCRPAESDFDSVYYRLEPGSISAAREVPIVTLDALP
jgi:hypothetical protein